MGDQNHIHIKAGPEKLVTLADPASDLKAGDNVTLTLNQSLFFDEQGRRIR